MDSVDPGQSLIFTCGVCGSPLGPLLLLPLPTGQPAKCKVCGLLICEKHFSKFRKICVRCERGSDSWCETPAPLETSEDSESPESSETE